MHIPETYTPPEHRSVSQLRTYLRCARQWGYRYIMGIKSPPNWAMRGGTAIDDMLTRHNTEKAEGKGGFNVSAAQDFFRDRVIEVAEESDLPKNEEMSQVIDDGTRVIPPYMKDVDPIIHPVSAQKKVEVDLGGVPMVGYIDLVREAEDGHRIVSDYKFTRRSPSAGSAAASMQLAFYDKAEGGEPGHVELIGLVRTKKPKVATDSHFVTKRDHERVERMARFVNAGIKSNYFPMASPENEWGNAASTFCHPDRCGYWDICAGRSEGPLPIPGEMEV